MNKLLGLGIGLFAISQAVACNPGAESVPSPYYEGLMCGRAVSALYYDSKAVSLPLPGSAGTLEARVWTEKKTFNTGVKDDSFTDSSQVVDTVLISINGEMIRAEPKEHYENVYLVRSGIDLHQRVGGKPGRISLRKGTSDGLQMQLCNYDRAI